jgi:hypothetical protein
MDRTPTAHQIKMHATLDAARRAPRTFKDTFSEWAANEKRPEDHVSRAFTLIGFFLDLDVVILIEQEVIRRLFILGPEIFDAFV